jgi:hypothetical protein
VPTIKAILQRELGLEKFPRRWAPHFLSPTQNIVHLEASIDMLRIPHELEENHFEGIVTGDGSWFQHSNISMFLSVLKNVCMIADRRFFMDATSHQGAENSDNDFCHRTQTNRALYLPKRK